MTETPQQPSPEQPAAASSQPTPPTQRDTTMGWLSHLLLLFTCFIGPLVVYLTKKDTDKYAAFHAKQALCWWIALFVAIVAAEIVSAILAAIAGPLVFLGMCVIWLACIGNLVYVIIAVIKTAKGQPFKYIFVADKFCAKEFAEAYPGQGA